MDNLIKQINEVELKYGLQFDSKISEFYGALFVEDNDCYQVSINISPFPHSFPIVKELGERIPFNIDRHKYNDASCCITTKAKEQLLLKKRIKSLDDFIKGIVIPFFQNNSYFEINKEYISGDYKHDIAGVFEAYQEIANINDVKLLLEILYNRVMNKKHERNGMCFCKSGKKFKNCHITNYSDLFLIEKNIIIQDIAELIKILDPTN
jgi:SEC-C motif-containing protein